MSAQRLFLVAAPALLNQAAAGPESVVTGSAVPSMSGYLGQSFFALLIIVAAIFLVVWLLRRYGGFQASGSGRIQVVDGVSVGQRERVLLLRVGKEHLVVGVAQGQISDLGRVEISPEEVAAADPDRGTVGGIDFSAQLARLMKRSPKS